MFENPRDRCYLIRELNVRVPFKKGHTLMNNSMLYLAYLDPGTGAMVLQVIIDGFLTTMVAFRGIFYKVFFYSKKLFRVGPDCINETILETEKTK